ncbi:MAG: hypothetical protein ACREFK_10030 [Stellaceae bacterium]
MSSQDFCAICGAPATRIADGASYCRVHSPYSARPGDPPPAPCAICEAPSNRREHGLPFCGAHDFSDLPPRAA